MSLLCGLNNQVDVNTLTVSPSSVSIITECPTFPSFATLKLQSDGEEKDNTPNPCSPATTSSRGNWLDAGDSSDVWVERIINSGSLNDLDPGAGRLQLSSTRTYGITAGELSSHAANVTFNFYDAASGGNLIGSSTVVFSCDSDIT